MADIVLSSNIIISNFIVSDMIIGVRCENCHLNQKRTFTKNEIKCFRPAKFNKETIIINCGIYKKSKG